MKLKITKGGQPFYSIDLEKDHIVEIVDDQGPEDPHSDRLLIVQQETDSHGILLSRWIGPLFIHPVSAFSIAISLAKEEKR